MSTPNERTIRDQLAAHLEALEPNLRLIGTEVRVDNPDGSFGLIDILCEDAFGHRVIVELKRSDQAARQAIHEAHKYVNLYTAKAGLRRDQVRVLIVSTEWRELLAPFSDWVHSTDLQVTGFRIAVGANGRVTSAATVPPLPPTDPMDPFQCHHMCLYEHEAEARRHAEEFRKAVEAFGVEDYVLLTMHYRGPNKAVIYPWGFYLVVAGVSRSLRDRIETELREEEELAEAETIDRYALEEQVLTKIVEAANIDADEVCVGYPDRLQQLIADGWEPVGDIRGGRVAAEQGRSTEQLLREIAGVGGGSGSHYFAISTATARASWGRFKDQAHGCLRGNRAWTEGFDRFAVLAQKSAAIRIYHPENLLVTLGALSAGCLAYVPDMEGIAEGDNGEIVMLYGVPEWDGRTMPNVDNVLSDELASQFMIEQTLHAYAEFDPQRMAMHGLSYVSLVAVVSGSQLKSQHFCRVNDETVEWTSEFPPEGRTLSDFAQQGREYLSLLSQRLARIGMSFSRRGVRMVGDPD